MKRMLLLGFFLALGLGLARSQNAPYRVVFDLTSRDSLDQKAVIRWVREISDANLKPNWRWSCTARDLNWSCRRNRR